jgi:ATP-dependent DNA helicase DinG
VEIHELLGADGPLARSIPGFAVRRVQQDMAQAVADTLERDERLIVEAGTGTGKTFAYLVPALLSGRRVVVSTGTKNLQDQLFHRDLPRVREALGVAARTALLKGRANYLCLYRMKRARHLPGLRAFHARLAEVESWARRTDSGDLAELGAFDPADPLPRQLTSTADNCLSSRCPDFEQCHVVKARRAAQGADVAVINHHLLFADFLLKDEGFGQMLSGTEGVIVDEAHQLAELAAQFFGVRLSTRQLGELARDVQQQSIEVGDVPAVREAAEVLIAETARFEAAFLNLPPRLKLAEFLAREEAATQLARAREALEALHQLLRPLEERSAEFSNFVARSLDLSARVGAIADEDERETVRWVETGARGGSLHATPIEVAPAFQRMLGTYPGAWVFTSATLTGSDDFAHFAGELGLGEARKLQLDSPFDFATQARLYLPRGLPEPNAPTYADAVADAALPVIEAAGGGVFLLCTSYRALRQIAERLRARLALRVLAQGEDARSALLDAFTADGNAVLVGTSSFWEGVDVKGRALRVVIIDKLPFAAPGDPLFEARLEAIRNRGGNPFFELQLPEAIVMLRQGVGRLIRDAHDRGLLMLCDPRLRGKTYGARVLAALPRMPVLESLDQACAWLEHIEAAA